MEQKAAKKASNNLMEYPIGGKTVKEYLSIVKMPVMALIGLSVINFLMGFLNYIPFLGFAFAILNAFVGLVIFAATLIIGGYIGYIIVKKHSGDLLNASAGGAIAGLISRAVGGVLNLVSAGIGLGTGFGFGRSFVMAAAMVGLILSPVIGAIIGGILALIGGLIAGARNFGPVSSTASPEAPKPKE